MTFAAFVGPRTAYSAYDYRVPVMRSAAAYTAKCVGECCGCRGRGVVGGDVIVRCGRRKRVGSSSRRRDRRRLKWQVSNRCYVGSRKK